MDAEKMTEVAEFVTDAINLVNYHDYNLYYYFEIGISIIGVLIGVLIGCFFWYVVTNHVG